MAIPATCGRIDQDPLNEGSDIGDRHKINWIGAAAEYNGPTRGCRCVVEQIEPEFGKGGGADDRPRHAASPKVFLGHVLHPKQLERMLC